MNKKVSVIVPVYHSEPYLKTCIDSVIKQTYRDFELLLITDGPTDGSEELCRRFVQRDQRSRLIPQAHQGVSAARNKGIENAAGEYLFFMDSDDAIHPQLLEALIKLAERTEAAIVAEDFRNLSSGQLERKMSSPVISRRKPFENYGYLDTGRALEGFLLQYPQEQVLHAVRGKLIRSSVARTARFDEKSISGEDTKYMYQLLVGGADVAILYEEGYYYRIRPGSLSRERTINACKSWYTCNRSIWLHEKEKGRRLYARRWKEESLKKLAAWYVAARISKDRALAEYILKLGKREKNFIKDSQTGWRVKLECFLAFRCYPLYQICHVMRGLWRKITCI